MATGAADQQLNRPARRRHSEREGLQHMTEKKVWIVTGAGRGMGVDIATAAPAGGNAVVAYRRNPDVVADADGEATDLPVVTLDVTTCADAHVGVNEVRRTLHRRLRRAHKADRY